MTIKEVIDFVVWLQEFAFATYQLEGQYAGKWHIHNPHYGYVSTEELLEMWNPALNPMIQLIKITISLPGGNETISDIVEVEIPNNTSDEEKENLINYEVSDYVWSRLNVDVEYVTNPTLKL